MKNVAKRVLAQRLRKKVQKLLAVKDLEIIAITGTVGKTSTKVAIAKLLESAGRKVGYSEDSYNSDIGLPLSIFGLSVPSRLADGLAWQRTFTKINKLIKNFPHDTLVLEIAEDDLALMMPFMKLIRPKLGVISGVSIAHTARMDNLERITRDIAQLMSTTDQLVCNYDFPQLREGDFAGAMTYGLEAGAEVRFGKVKRGSDGLLSGELRLGSDAKVVNTQMVGRHSLESLLAAATVARAMGVSPAKIASGLAKIAPVRGRMNLLAAVNGARLIDDSYNAASPVGVHAALNTLADFDTKNGRKIAVLGSMNELGPLSVQAHTEVGAAAAKIADLVVAVGTDAEAYIAPAAIESGMERSQVKAFGTPYEAGHFLKDKVTADDVILVKGSQNGVFSEEVSRILLDPHLDPTKVLVRQSEFWKRKKKKAFAL